MNIYLASKSPRRKALLEQMEIPFEILDIETPEIVNPDETPLDYSKRVTTEKLHAAWDKLLLEEQRLQPVLCADTEVVLDGKIIGKPQDEDDAFHTLKQYSGRTHQVITSVGLIYDQYRALRTETTLVSFANLTDDAIQHYLASGNYKDKSGSYGIQSYIGQFISRIEGCFYSVMGLPLNTVRIMLDELYQKFAE